MTLDVRIGKLAIRRGDLNYNDEKSQVWIGCDKCPDAKEDICEVPYTLWPRESYRSGSGAYWEWWEMNEQIDELYHLMRPHHPDSNDIDVALLKPLLDEINSLEEIEFKELYGEDNERNLDRLKWLKYWANKAVELYGDDAVIMFS